jgi:hypothetical protein
MVPSGNAPRFRRPRPPPRAGATLSPPGLSPSAASNCPLDSLQDGLRPAVWGWGVFMKKGRPEDRPMLQNNVYNHQQECNRRDKITIRHSPFQFGQKTHEPKPCAMPDRSSDFTRSVLVYRPYNGGSACSYDHLELPDDGHPLRLFLALPRVLSDRLSQTGLGSDIAPLSACSFGVKSQDALTGAASPPRGSFSTFRCHNIE